jgi:glycosyltransferase involved in cell wall biosynthesis
MPEKPEVGIFFPAFNEEGNIEQSVRSAVEVLSELCSDYEVLVVNDASTDRTGEIADSLARHNSKIRVIHHPENRKLGGAMRTGFREAKKEFVFYVDADNPVDFRDLGKALELMDGSNLSDKSDVVIGYRLNRDETLKRTIYSKVYNLMIRILFGLKVKDVNFSFKLFRRRVLDTIPLRTASSFLDAELLIASKRAGFTINEIGIRYYPRITGKSTMASPKVIWKVVCDMSAYLFHPPKIDRFAGRGA